VYDRETDQPERSVETDPGRRIEPGSATLASASARLGAVRDKRGSPAMTARSVQSLQGMIGNSATSRYLSRLTGPVQRQHVDPAEIDERRDPTDAGVEDAGVPDQDAGVEDAGVPDQDAGVEDAGVPDQDAGVEDAGVPDDAGEQPSNTPDGGIQPDVPALPGPDGGQQPGPDQEEVTADVPDGGAPAPDTVREEAGACEPNPEYVELVEQWGEPGSPQRQQAINQAYDNANGLESFGKGFLGGGVVSLVSLAAESGVVRMLATRGVSQAAKAAGPVGAIVGGVIGAYSLWNRGPEGIASAFTLTGFNEGSGDELLANRWNAIAELLDVLGAIADVVAGIAGAIALGGILIGLIPGGQWALPAVPIAAQVALYGGLVGLACTVLKGICQQVAREYREAHLLNMELASSEEMLYQQGRLTTQAQAGYEFLGGMAGAGTVAAGRHAAGRRSAANPERAPSPEAAPHEPTVVEARQAATPERLDQLRNVDDALAPSAASRANAPEGPRAETDAARDWAPEAQQRHADAEARHARSEEAARSAAADDAAAADRAAASDAELAAAREEAAARQREHDAGLEQQARSDAATSAARESREAASAAAADYRTKDQASVEARRAQNAQQAEVRRLEAEARRHRETEAAAMEEYRDMEGGQMPLAIAENAAAQARNAEAQLGPARERLTALQEAREARAAEAAAARTEWETRQAVADALAEHASAQPGRPSDADVDATRDASMEADRRAREAGEIADRERAAADTAAARAAELEAQRQADGLDATERRNDLDTADERDRGRVRARLRQAHESEVAGARETPNVRREQAETVGGIAGAGGTAQDVLGGAFEATPERTMEVPAPCLVPPPPTSSAAIEQETVESMVLDEAAGQAAAQQAEAEADEAARAQDRSNLEDVDQAIQERQSEADETTRGLDARQETQGRLESTQQRIDTNVDEAGSNTGDLTSFARFIGRMMGYASRLDDDLFPDSIRAAGRGIARRGEQIQSTTSGTTEGIAEQRSGRGAVQAAAAQRRTTTEQALGEMPGTASTVQDSAAQVSEMLSATDERQAAAADSAGVNRDVRGQAAGRAAELRARRDQDRAALDAWAASSQQARSQWIAETRADLEARGYEVTGVRGA
jgi:hypothetical protein